MRGAIDTTVKYPWDSEPTTRRVSRQEANSVGGYLGRRRAFSIFEMAIVVFILGVVTSIAVPRFANALAHQRLEAAVRRAIVDLKLAQRRARSTTTSHRIVFTLPRSYRMQFYDGDSWEAVPHPDHPGQAYVVSLSGEPYNVSISKADFGGDLVIVFDGYGVPDSGGTLRISSGEYEREMTLNEETGRAEVE